MTAGTKLGSHDLLAERLRAGNRSFAVLREVAVKLNDGGVCVSDSKNLYDLKLRGPKKLIGKLSSSSPKSNWKLHEGGAQPRSVQSHRTPRIVPDDKLGARFLRSAFSCLRNRSRRSLSAPSPRTPATGPLLDDKAWKRRRGGLRFMQLLRA